MLFLNLVEQIRGLATPDFQVSRQAGAENQVLRVVGMGTVHLAKATLGPAWLRCVACLALWAFGIETVA